MKIPSGKGLRVAPPQGDRYLGPTKGAVPDGGVKNKIKKILVKNDTHAHLVWDGLHSPLAVCATLEFGVHIQALVPIMFTKLF